MVAVATRRSPGRQRLRILLAAAEPSRRAAFAALTAKSFAAGSVAIQSQPAISGLRAADHFADIVITDIDSPAAAASLLQFMKERAAGVGAVALIDDPDPRWVQAAIEAGVNAIISRDATAEELHLALTAADAGLILLYPASVRALWPATLKDSDLAYEPERLTARELEILRLMSDGLGNKEIAARLAISDHTAKSHISSILGKMGVASRTEAVSQGIRRGLIPI